MGARGRFVKLLIDENLPVVIVELARRQEIEASSVRDELPGAPDLKILERLQSTGETLVTRDIRFANHVLEQIATGKPLGGAFDPRAENGGHAEGLGKMVGKPQDAERDCGTNHQNHAIPRVSRTED